MYIYWTLYETLFRTHLRAISINFDSFYSILLNYLNFFCLILDDRPSQPVCLPGPVNGEATNGQYRSLVEVSKIHSEDLKWPVVVKLLKRCWMNTGDRSSCNLFANLNLINSSLRLTNRWPPFTPMPNSRFSDRRTFANWFVYFKTCSQKVCPTDCNAKSELEQLEILIFRRQACRMSAVRWLKCSLWLSLWLNFLLSLWLSLLANLN